MGHLLPEGGGAGGHIDSPLDCYDPEFFIITIAEGPGALPVSASRQGPAGSPAGRPTPRRRRGFVGAFM